MRKAIELLTTESAKLRRQVLNEDAVNYQLMREIDEINYALTVLYDVRASGKFNAEEHEYMMNLCREA